MKKIKRFLDCYIPITTCNLQCSYCYIAQQGLFKSGKTSFEHSPQEMRQALSKKRLGGPCLINLCAGGETLLVETVVQIIEELLKEGHYVMVVTNGLISKRFEQLLLISEDLQKRLFIKFSFHYLELRRLQLFDVYFENVLKIKNSNISFSVELTPCDDEIPYIEDIQKRCKEKLGNICHVTIGRSDIDPEHRIPHLSGYSFEEYCKIWKQFDSELFNFKRKIFYQKRKEFCYAGEWTAYINLGTGEMKQCYCGEILDNIYQNTDAPLKFRAIGSHCEFSHCYNGHVWLAFGNIPELDAPTYAQLRNRECEDGQEWLKPEIKEVFSTKLNETNKKYSLLKKYSINNRKK